MEASRTVGEGIVRPCSATHQECGGEKLWEERNL